MREPALDEPAPGQIEATPREPDKPMPKGFADLAAAIDAAWKDHWPKR